ncbi:MAG TPA: Gfo/Idh/MocA family oxidoreductase [Bdellovibrionales bacterium]|nr:Gfo/Idh/MocA family oxidoreductase [Bdellovibrionales bacterium]
MTPVRSAVVGVGYLGRFHAQKYKALETAGLSKLVAVCDSSEARAAEIGKELGVPALTDYRQLIGKVDAVSVAADTSVHHEVAKFFLQNGIHVLVEKPIAATSAEAEELVALSEEKDLVLQVGHIERFSPPFRLASQNATAPLSLEFQRMAPFGPRSNARVDVVVDLMIHDLDLALCLDPSPVRTVAAWGWSLATPLTDVAIAHLNFESGMVASFTASRVAPSLIRRMHLVQEGSTIAVDFASLTYDICRARVGEPPAVESQKFEKTDALLAEVESFLRAVGDGQKIAVTGRAGTEALRLAEKIVELINASRE